MRCLMEMARISLLRFCNSGSSDANALTSRGTAPAAFMAVHEAAATPFRVHVAHRCSTARPVAKSSESIGSGPEEGSRSHAYRVRT